MNRKPIASFAGLVFTATAFAGSPVLPSKENEKQAPAQPAATNNAQVKADANFDPSRIRTDAERQRDQQAPAEHGATTVPPESKLARPAVTVPGKFKVNGAGKSPTSLSTDTRVRKIVYDAAKVVAIRAAYGFTAMIELGEDESIQHISLGDTVAWQAVPRKNNILFLKPQEENAETNMLVVTSKRNYSFSLIAFRPKNFSDPQLTYSVKFVYPEEEMRRVQEEIAAARNAEIAARKSEAAATVAAVPTTAGPARRASSPADWNFKYSFKGSSVAAPVKMFDDGQFTYIHFANYDSIPAMFLVDSDKKESLLNYRREGEWIVVERIARQMTFRANNNTEVACIFNDAFPDRPASSLVDRSGGASATGSPGM